MATTPSKTLSPAELAKLEHAFATEPASDAYRALAEAYLGMGRFMEAMVVCKKGVKAHPNAADPRMLLARVYAEQGKDKKALEELAGALPLAPKDKALLRLSGVLHLKTGDAEGGKANLLKAYELDPADAETLAALAQWKVEPPRPPEPPTEKVPLLADAQAPVAGPGAMRPQVVARSPRGPAAPSRAVPRPDPTDSVIIDEDVGVDVDVEVDVAPPPPARPAPARPAPPRPPNGAPARGQAPAIGRTPSQAARPAQRYVPPPEDYEDEEEEERPRRKRKSKGSLGTKAVFLTLAVGVPLALVGYYVVGQYQARRTREFNKTLTEAGEQLKHDSYDSYQRACKAADQALELNPSSGTAHAYLAYAYAIRWGEHGGGDQARSLAEEHLDAAKQAGETSSYLYAAQALIQNYAGKGSAALKELEDTVHRLDSEGRKSSLLYLTLGIIQMNAGDLERAQENLEQAQGLATSDPRVYSALGALNRRRGQDRQALQMFDFALKYERDHPDSLLGLSLMILDQEQPNYGFAWKMLNKLVEAVPPPSPRQLATAYAAEALLISRLSADLPDLKPETQKELREQTKVPEDNAAAQAMVRDLEGKAFNMDARNPELYLIKARRLRLNGNIDGAVAELKKAIAMDGSRAHFHVELAKNLMDKPGGENEAKDALLAALRVMGDSPKLLVMMGTVYRRLGRTDEALAQLQKAVANPKAKNPDAWLALGQVYREKRDWAKGQEALDKAAQQYLSQPARAAATYTELGRMLEEKGDRPKADEAFQKALNADPEYSPSYYFYAKFLSGDRASLDKAKTTAQEYVKREPKGEFIADAQRLAQ